MNKLGLKKRVKEFFKIGFKELIQSIKLIPIYILLGAICLIVLKYVPDYLIVTFKPEHLSKSDSVTYFCTIIALFGVFVTLFHNQKMVQKQLDKSEEINRDIIKQSDKKFEEERKLDVLPVITISEITDIWQNSNYGEFNYQQVYDIVGSDIENSIKYVHKVWNNIGVGQEAFQIGEDSVTYDPFQTLPMMHNILMDYLDFLNGTLKQLQYFFAPFKFVNSGKGTAVNINISVFHINDNNEELKLCSSDISRNLNVGEYLKVVFYNWFYETIPYSDYLVRIVYFDIYENGYQQDHFLKLVKEPSSKREYIFMMNANIKQKPINK